MAKKKTFEPDPSGVGFRVPVRRVDLDLIGMCREAVQLLPKELQDGGDYSSHWTVEKAIDYALRDGRGPRIGAVGWSEQKGVLPVVLPYADLSGRDLSKADFSFCDLTGVDFSRCDLTDARLIHCNIRQADFTDAILDGCDFFESTVDKDTKPYDVIVERVRVSTPHKGVTRAPDNDDRDVPRVRKRWEEKQKEKENRAKKGE